MPYRKVPHWTPDNGLEVLTFGLGGETFALEAGIVREILDMMPVTMVPGADALADLRGSFGMEAHAATADSRIIVIELDMDGAPILIGLTADRVDEVTVLHAGDAEEAPVIGMRWPREHVRCLVRRGGDVVVLPDLAALFSRLTARGGEPVSVH